MVTGYAPRGAHEAQILHRSAGPGGMPPSEVSAFGSRGMVRWDAVDRLVARGLIRNDGYRLVAYEIEPGRFITPPPAPPRWTPDGQPIR